MNSIPCPRCHGTKEVYAAGNRIARTCSTCEGKGRLDADEAMTDSADREIEQLRTANRELDLEALQLRSIKADYERRMAELEQNHAAALASSNAHANSLREYWQATEKRIRELEAAVELRESCLRAYSVRIHELFGVSIVSPESWDNIPHCLAIVKGRFEKLEAKVSELDTEASHLRSAFTKAHTGHDCEGRPCWMRETYERSLKRAEADEKRERAAGKHANCPDNPCPRVFPYCEDEVTP